MALWKRISIALVSLLICVSLFVGTASYGTVKKLIIQNKEDDIENVLNLIDMSVTEQLLQFNAIVDSTIFHTANMKGRRASKISYRGKHKSFIVMIFMTIRENYFRKEYVDSIIDRHFLFNLSVIYNPHIILGCIVPNLVPRGEVYIICSGSVNQF